MGVTFVGRIIHERGGGGGGRHSLGGGRNMGGEWGLKKVRFS
jgi:hypothetical protein